MSFSAAERQRRYRAKHPLTPEQRLAANERAKAWRLANPKQDRANSRKWRAANPEARVEEGKRCRAKHAERERDRVAAHQKAHPEQSASRQRRYLANHPEAREVRAEYMRAYFQSDAGRAAASANNRKRRAQKLGCDAPATAVQVTGLLMGAVACCYCESQFTEANTPTIDHFIPLAKGGAHEIGNLVVACGLCNSRKCALMPHEFAARYPVTIPDFT